GGTGDLPRPLRLAGAGGHWRRDAVPENLPLHGLWHCSLGGRHRHPAHARRQWADRWPYRRQAEQTAWPHGTVRLAVLGKGCLPKVPVGLPAQTTETPRPAAEGGPHGGIRADG